jgi:hypothetical protein
LTLFLLWPLLLACVMVSSYWNNLLSVGAYALIVLLTCLNTALLALFCSVVFRKTSTSLMTTYLLIILLYCAPLATIFISRTFYPNRNVSRFIEAASVTSPFVAVFSVPLSMGFEQQHDPRRIPSWRWIGGYVLFTTLLNALLLVLMVWLFNTRWRVAE